MTTQNDFQIYQLAESSLLAHPQLVRYNQEFPSNPTTPFRCLAAGCASLEGYLEKWQLLGNTFATWTWSCNL